MEYKQVGIPKIFFQRFLKFQPMLGYRSFSEFVVDAVRDKCLLAELKSEDILDKKVEERMMETTYEGNE
jgi:hypothetical protein